MCHWEKEIKSVGVVYNDDKLQLKKLSEEEKAVKMGETKRKE